MATKRFDPREPDPSSLSFWRERRVCTLTTLRRDGTPHTVPVGATYDPEAGLARVITSKSSTKVANVLAAGGGDGTTGAPVSVCQFEGRHWSTLEGRARIRTEPDQVVEAERRYEERYGHPPRPNPHRVVIEIELTAAMGTS